MEQPGPYKPDTVERNEYYYGLDGKPKLVARTGSDRWTKPDYTGPFTGTTPKHYDVVVDAGTIANFFFPIRIGLNDVRSSKIPTVLLIGVAKDALSWERAINIALECRQTLRNAEINDLEVEVCEAVYTSHTAYSELAAEIGERECWSSENAWTNILALPMLSSGVGGPIGYMRDCEAEGTIGLHIRLGDQSTELYGLTCRHVVCLNRQPDDSYTAAQDQLNQQEHVHASTRAYEECLSRLEKHLERQETLLAFLQEKRRKRIDGYQYVEGYENRCSNDLELAQIEYRKRQISHAQSINELIKNMSDKTTRRIGHLACHPKLEMAPDHHYLKDWALVRLDNEERCHNTNRVYIGREEAREFEVMDLALKNGFLSLYLRYLDPEIGDHTPQVAKQGATSGFTIGRKSGVEAVIRRYALLPDQTTREMVIISNDKHKPFSAGGDSGSAIFNRIGAVIGLLTGSTKRPEETGLPRFQGTDVTFATPIEWVLEDIARFTGLRPRLAEDIKKEN